MTTENIICIAIAAYLISIAIAISFAVAYLISVAIFVFDLTVSFLFLNAGVFNSSSATDHNNNAQETATSNLGTSIVLTPSAGVKTKVSPPTVSPSISLLSPVITCILPFSPYKCSPMRFFTRHNLHRLSFLNKPCLPANNNITRSLKKPPLPIRSNLHALKTSKPTDVVSLSTQKSHTKITAKAKHAKPRVVDGTDNKYTKSVKKHVVAGGNGSKPKSLTSRKPQIPCAPRLSADVSHFFQTRTKVTPNGNGTDNITESVKKHFVYEGNDTKPKIISSRKPQIPCAPRLSSDVSHFIQSRTKPKNLTSRKPQIPYVLRSSAAVSKCIQTNKVTPNTRQAQSVKKPPVVDGACNGTKPKVPISTKLPIPPRCSNLPLQSSRPAAAALSLSTQKTHITVTPKGCIQRWRQ